MLKIAAFASHGGSNLQAIIDGCKNSGLDAKVCLIISNNSKSYALKRGEKEGIKTYHISSIKYKNPDEKILDILIENKIDIIVLAGYMKKFSNSIIEKYENRILNIHPALLPKYGGKGMYGINVHKAVIEAGEKKSGATVHLVTKNYDEGKILNQIEVEVKETDTPEDLAKRVLEKEHKIYIDTIKKIVNKEIILD